MLTSFKNTITGLILLALRWRLELVRQPPEVTEQRSDDGNGGTRCSRHRRMPLGGIQVATGINRNGCGNSGRVHGHLYGGTRGYVFLRGCTEEPVNAGGTYNLGYKFNSLCWRKN